MNKYRSSHAGFNPRALPVAEIVWDALRRNEEYKRYYRESEGNPRPLRRPSIFAWSDCQLRWGIWTPIPPEKKFGEPFPLPYSNIIVKGREHWATLFLNYIEPVSIEHPQGATPFARCTLNLSFPRNVIIDRFKHTLSQVRRGLRTKGRKSQQHLHRLKQRSGRIDTDYYAKVFHVYDKVEKIKLRNQRLAPKRIGWKLVSSDMNEKEARNAYAKAKQLIDGGFRLIS